MPYLTGQQPKSPRESFIYVSDDGDLTAIRYDNWKLLFDTQEVQGTFKIWQNPLTKWRIPFVINLRTDPYERAPITSNTYYDWVLDHLFLAYPTEKFVADFLQTFKEFPPRQKSASFTIDQVLQKMLQPTDD